MGAENRGNIKGSEAGIKGLKTQATSSPQWAWNPGSSSQGQPWPTQKTAEKGPKQNLHGNEAKAQVYQGHGPHQAPAT